MSKIINNNDKSNDWINQHWLTTNNDWYVLIFILWLSSWIWIQARTSNARKLATIIAWLTDRLDDCFNSGYLRGSRLESEQRPPSDGSSSSIGAKTSRQRLSTNHQKYHWGENYELTGNPITRNTMKPWWRSSSYVYFEDKECPGSSVQSL